MAFPPHNNLSAPAVALIGFSLLGIWGLLGINGRDGFLSLLKGILKAPVQLLPVVNQPVRQTFTGIPPIDAIIRQQNVLLWPAIDGTWPGLSLSAWEQSGQFSATWMVAGLEGLRAGNRGKLVSYTTVVATLSQLTTYATILPLYLFLHLLTTPTSLGSVVTSSSKNIAEDFLVEPAELAAWAPAFALSYGLLTVLVALPSPKITSFSTHQGFMAIWTFYPIAFKILQLLLARYLFAALFTPTASSSGSSKSSAQQRATTLALLKKTYAFIAIIAGVSHIITLTLSFSTVFFPSIFTTDTVTNFSPLKVFLPVSPFYSTKVENVGQGLWVFAGWNNAVSTAAPLLWGLVQLRNATSTKRKGWEGWPVVLAKIGALSVIGGPGVAFAWCLWKRDEVVLGALDRDEKVE